MKSTKTFSLPTNFSYSAVVAIALAMIFSLFPQTIPNYPISSAAANGGVTVGSGVCQQTVNENTNTSVVVSQSGTDCIVTFRYVGTKTWTVPTGVNTIQLLLVGGGGGGGGGSRSNNDGGRGAGGGGAGGNIYFNQSVSVTGGQPATVVVAGGGTGGAANNNNGGFGTAGTAGGTSSFTLGANTINAAGGSGGGAQTANTQNDAGGDGGATSTLVNGTTTNRTGGNSVYEGAGGGAGAGANGSNGSDIGGRGGNGGDGGVGLSLSISGTAVFYAGGGGGGGTAGDSLNGFAGAGGSGGGGAGGIYQTLPRNGSNQVGGGGGGGGGWRDSTNVARAGAAGGSGVVIIRFKPAGCAASTDNLNKTGLVVYLDATDPCSTGATGLWRDVSGNGRDLTWTKAPVLRTTDPKHYDFERSNGHYGQFDNAGLNDFTTGFSISFFARFDAAGTWERIIDLGNGENDDNIFVGRDAGSTRLVATLKNNAVEVRRVTSPDQMIFDGQWAHYAVSIGTGTAAQWYRNGVPVTTTNSGTGLPTSVAKSRNYLGESNWAADAFFDGGIASLAIYNTAIEGDGVISNYAVQARSVPSSTEITDSGNKYAVTTFTSVGTNNWTVPAGVTSVEILVVGGGGAAGFGRCGGGGGAGAVLVSTPISVTGIPNLAITVGSGGLGGWQTAESRWSLGTKGGSSSVKIGDNTYTAIGGGGGGGTGIAANANGTSGGSGGGGTRCGIFGDGGAANTTAVQGITPLANNGAGGATSSGGGGGGGAGTAATNSNGGNGVTLWGVALAGGGGGWGGGVGGSGGGGSATGTYNLISAASAGTPGAFGTGSGGGGGNNGGSGRVAIRYQLAANPCEPDGSGITATGERIGNDCVITITQSTGAKEWNVPDTVGEFSVLVVGGGGGGGVDAGAGGGGGAIYSGTVFPAPGANRKATITIGAGGAGSKHSSGVAGSDGQSSIFQMSNGGTYTITSPGGKLGGGSGANTGGAGGAGGAIPTVTDAATNISGTEVTSLAGGTGGAGVPYNSTTAARPGTGGVSNTIAKFPGSYGGGGGGGATQYGGSAPGRPGGLGVNGGGNGSGGYDATAGRVTSFATAGTANTGGGGGGGSAHGSTALYSINGENWYSRDAKAGGSGIIKIRFSLVPNITITPDEVYVGKNAAITSYSVVSRGGKPTSYAISPAASGFTFDTTTGLISGTPNAATSLVEYTVTATVNGIATTSSDTFKFQVFDGSRPEKPVINNIAPGNGELKVSFTQPPGESVAEITGYKYSIDNGATYTSTSTRTSPLTIPGLTNNSSYAIKIIAVNGIGDSDSSDPVSSTPRPACATRTTNTATHVIVEITSTTTCSWSVPGATTAEMLIVGGGGGGGYGWGGGGGGGGVLHSTAQPLTADDSIVVNVGEGGAGGNTVAATSKGTNGEDSTVNFFVTNARVTYAAKGGGGGGGYGWGAGLTVGTGLTGGSAGGHGEIPSGTTLGRINGTQLSIGTFTGYANAGGSMYGGGSQAGSGGGGAGAAGGNALSFRAPGAGGAGKSFDLVSAEGVYYAGGGGGASITGAAGGIGGGGRGSNSNSTATAGTNGLGGGGGGSVNEAAAKGGSGIVIIKYANVAAKTTFDAKNGETPREIAQASFTASPFTPVKLGYTFNGWFAAETGGSAITYPYTSADQTVYAQWTAKACAVEETTFVGNGTNGGTTGVNYRVFRFTTPGDCIWTKPTGLTSLNVLAVGGGGGGGSAFDTGGGGGGAGGQVKQQTIDVTSVTELVIAVGAGGAGGRSAQTPSVSETAGSAGLASELYANGVRIVNALGGDGGSASRVDYFIAAGLSGRNVGTGGASGASATQARGGSHGGNASSATAGRGGGGGGAGGVGSGGSATFTSGGPGGVGVSSTITGTATTYGTGGTGGRGSGTTANRSNGAAGASNLGNGGGGASAGPSSSFNGGAGGSGIVILRAEVTGERYTVTYNTTGGTALSAGSFVAGGTVTQPANPIRAGYTLSGWSLTDGGASLTFPYTPPTNQNLTLFAKWSANQVSVVFNANDGTTTSKVQSVTAGTETALSANTFERVGYSFAGWSVNANGTGNQYADEEKVTLLSPLEVYAKWTADELEITFVKNDGSDTADVVQTRVLDSDNTSALITAGVAVTLKANTFTRAGFVFSGWTDSSGAKIGDGAQVRINFNVKYFANWTPIEFTVTYSLNGGAAPTPTQANVAAGGTFTVANAPTRTGYSFDGWSDGSKLYQAGETYTVAGNNVNLIAQWEKDSFIVYYSENGGTGTLSRTEDRFRSGDSAIVLPGRGTLVKTGFTFGGWSATDSGASVGATYTPSANATLYAVWLPNYTITYSANGGSGTLARSSEISVGGAAITLPANTLSKTGFTFGGWSDGTTTFAAGAQYPATGTISADKTLTAVWNAATYNITYNGNTNTAGTAPAATTYTYSESGAVLAAEGDLVKTNHRFGGWSITDSGAAIVGSYRPTADATLYAVWIPVVTVTYDVQGATGAVANQTVDTNSVITLNDATGISKTNNIFGGWSIGGITYPAGTRYVVAAAVSVSAIWIPVVTVTFTASDNGVTGTVPSAQTVNAGTTITLPSGAGLSRTDFVFAGWSTGGVTYPPSSRYIVGETATTFAAVWIASLTVVYELNGGSITNPVKPSQFEVGASGLVTITTSTAHGIKAGDTVAVSGVGVAGITSVVVAAVDELTFTYTKAGAVTTAKTNADPEALITVLALGSITVTGATTYTTPKTAPTKTGQTFQGWQATKYFNGQQTNSISDALLDADTSISRTNNDPDTIVLRAIYSGDSFTVTYNLMGGSGTLPTQDPGAYGSQFTTAAPTGLTRSGYRLSGWSDGFATYTPVSQYTMRAFNVVLSAVWVKENSIRYQINGGTANPALPGTTTVDEGALYVISPAAITRTGYVFGGWSDGVTTRNAGASFTVGNKDIVLTAVWTAGYSVTYDLASGTANPVPSTSPQIEGAVFQLPSAPTRTNFTFAGWSDGLTRYEASANYTMKPFNTVITAMWTQDTYVVAYDLNGGNYSNGGTLTQNIPSVRVNAGEKHTITTQEVTRTGYLFQGWSTSLDEEDLINPADFTPTQAVTLYAIWDIDPIAITYDLNGGVGSATQTDKALGESFELAAAPTRANRIFLGWKIGSEIYLPGQLYRITSGPVEIQAQWSAASYIITYDLNGGSGTAPTQTPVASGGSFTIKSNLTGSTPLFTRANHEFDGWLIGADAKAIGAEITNVTTNVTVQAKWNPVIEVEFNSNGGSAVANPNITYRGGSGIAKPTDPTRADFVFGGWSDGNNIITTWPYVPALPVTLTAVWTQLSLAGIDQNKLVRLGTLVASASQAVSFTGSNPTNSVNVVVPAGSLPAGTKVNIDVVSEIVRAKELISNEVDFLVSLVVHWLAEDGTVPKTDEEKPVLVTIYNPAIKTGMVLYKIIGEQFTVLGRAAEDGVVTFEIFEDPEILVAATRPDAPVEVAGTATSPSSIEVSWVAPAMDGGADITGYTVTASNGASCTSTTLSCVITGLSASTPYTFSVIATNSVGNSAQSAASAEITTNPLPPAPGGAPIVPVVPTRPTPTGPVLETIDNRPITTPPGAAKRIVDGSVVTTIFTVINTHTIRTQFEGVTLEVRGLDRVDRNIPISNNTLVFERNGKAALSGGGLMGNTKLRVWLLSTPTFLGEVTTKSDGSFNLSSVIPRAFPLGDHTLQINGVSDKNQLITQTFGVTVVEKAPESNVVVPGTAKKALSLSMVPTQIAPTTKQLAKTTRLATTLPAKSVITCNSYVAAARPTAAQISQATRIANLLCAPFVANKALTTKFTKKAPKNAATLKWAKRKPIRVEVTVRAAN